jgi:hypothetical protein
VQELQARSAEENTKPNRGIAPYAMSMPRRSIILSIFAADPCCKPLVELIIANSSHPGFSGDNVVPEKARALISINLSGEDLCLIDDDGAE